VEPQYIEGYFGGRRTFTLLISKGMIMTPELLMEGIAFVVILFEVLLVFTGEICQMDHVESLQMQHYSLVNVDTSQSGTLT
jgi:hypothetical protein